MATLQTPKVGLDDVVRAPFKALIAVAKTLFAMFIFGVLLGLYITGGFALAIAAPISGGLTLLLDIVYFVLVFPLLVSGLNWTLDFATTAADI